MRKTIALSLYLLAAVTFVFIVSIPFRNPDPFTFQVALPERAEVLPASRVHPGTFKLELPWSQLNELVAGRASRAIVSFGGNRNKGGELIGVFPSAEIEAYLPRGDSTFYYATVRHTPDWPFGFLVGRVQRHGNEFVAYPEWTVWALVVPGLIAVILGLIGMIVLYPRHLRQTS